MKQLLLFIFLLSLVGCKDDPDFYKDGKAYKITKTCLDKHKEPRTGESISRYTGPYLYTYYEWVCTRERIDTTEIK